MSAQTVDPTRIHRPGGAAPAGQGSGTGALAAHKPTLSEASRKAFEREIAKYPPEGKASAVIACLAILQLEHGYITQASEELVAEALGMPPIAVHEVTTFYNMFNQVPVGRVKLNVCTNLPCQLRDGAKALHHLEHRLGIKMGETTADGMFTLQQSECLGACADSPVMLVNDRTMCSFMSEDKLDQLVDGLRKAQA
jgi:NADH-quinone oxidoreductase subunit E